MPDPAGARPRPSRLYLIVYTPLFGTGGNMGLNSFQAGRAGGRGKVASLQPGRVEASWDIRPRIRAL